MDTLPTYETQFNKITEAYIKDEIRPLDSSFCFCGTLCDKQSSWYIALGIRHKDYKGYTGNDFVRMELALISTIRIARDELNEFVGGIGGMAIAYPEKYETALFNGMVAALEVLKQIHIEHGEKIEEPTPFVKRTLTPSHN